MQILLKGLSPLEQEIMSIVWDKKTCSVRVVLEQIRKEKKLAYTTIATVLTRLHGKGLLKRSEKNAVVYFTPKVTREEFGKKVAGSFLKSFFQSFGDSALASFADSIEELPKSKKDYFIQLLEKQNENS